MRSQAFFLAALIVTESAAGFEWVPMTRYPVLLVLSDAPGGFRVRRWFAEARRLVRTSQLNTVLLD